MNGYTGVGKSFLAKKIGKHLPHTTVFHSAVIRKELNLQPDPDNEKLGKYSFNLADSVFIEIVSPIVYGEMLKRSAKIIAAGDNAIMDGSFSYRKQRIPVYEYAEKLSVTLCILHVTCRSENEIRKRLKQRKSSNNSSLDEAVMWNSYQSTVKLSETVINDTCSDGSRPCIIRYDSFTRITDIALISEKYLSNEPIKHLLKILRDNN